MLTRSPARKKTGGFSLVEMMIALVVGLIVVGAVLALMMAMVRANNQTVQATRLTQELRATAAVIAADIKRAHGVADPFAAARQGNNFALLDAPVNVPCIRYGYEGASGGGYHAIRLNANSSKVELVAANTFAGAACDVAGQQLSSAQVNITAMSFLVSGRRVDLTLTGSLANPGAGDTITRSLTQTVFVRSTDS